METFWYWLTQVHVEKWPLKLEKLQQCSTAAHTCRILSVVCVANSWCCCRWTTYWWGARQPHLQDTTAKVSCFRHSNFFSSYIIPFLLNFIILLLHSTALSSAEGQDMLCAAVMWSETLVLWQDQSETIKTVLSGSFMLQSWCSRSSFGFVRHSLVTSISIAVSYSVLHN